MLICERVCNSERRDGKGMFSTTLNNIMNNNKMVAYI